MRIMPKAKSRRIEFIQTHYPVWAANAAAIGTTPAEVAALQTLTTAAREALATQQKAQQEAQAATLALHQAVAAMNTAGRGIIGQIKAKAIVCGDEVYALANLSTPAAPKANTELGTPTHISISLDQSGGLKLMWKCRNPRSAGGVVYEIWRRNTLDGEFVYLGVRGEKTFVDTSIPLGT